MHKTFCITFKNFLLAGLAIAAYNLLYDVFYVGLLLFAPDSPLLDHYFVMDSVFCMGMLVLYAGWYLPLHREEREYPAVTLPQPAVRIPVLVLGMNALSSLWFLLAGTVLLTVPTISQSLEQFDESWSDLESDPYLAVLISVVIAGPIVEELLFRGIVFRYFEKICPGLFPAVLSGIAFGLWHGEPVQVVYTTLIGVLLGMIYQKTRDLRITIAIHVLNNFLSTLPPALDTEQMQLAISCASFLMLIPAGIIFVRLMKGQPRRDIEPFLC